MTILEVAADDDVTLEARSGSDVEVATGGQGEHQLGAFVDGAGGLGRGSRATASGRTVVVHIARTTLRHGAVGVKRSVGHHETRVKTSLVRNERIQDVGLAGVDGEGGGGLRVIHEARHRSGGGRREDRGGRRIVAGHRRSTEARQRVGAVGHVHREGQAADSTGVGSNDFPNCHASAAREGDGGGAAGSQRLAGEVGLSPGRVGNRAAGAIGVVAGHAIRRITRGVLGTIDNREADVGGNVGEAGDQTGTLSGHAGARGHADVTACRRRVGEHGLSVVDLPRDVLVIDIVFTTRLGDVVIVRVVVAECRTKPFREGDVVLVGAGLALVVVAAGGREGHAGLDKSNRQLRIGESQRTRTGDRDEHVDRGRDQSGAHAELIGVRADVGQADDAVARGARGIHGNAEPGHRVGAGLDSLVNVVTGAASVVGSAITVRRGQPAVAGGQAGRLDGGGRFVDEEHRFGAIANQAAGDVGVQEDLNVDGRNGSASDGRVTAVANDHNLTDFFGHAFGTSDRRNAGIRRARQRIKHLRAGDTGHDDQKRHQQERFAKTNHFLLLVKMRIRIDEGSL